MLPAPCASSSDAPSTQGLQTGKELAQQVALQGRSAEKVKAVAHASYEADTLIGDSEVEVISLVPDGREVTDDDGQTTFRLRGFWLDGLVDADSEIVPRWRRDASAEFPAHIWFEGAHWGANVVITAVEWGRRQGRVRLQARTRGSLRREGPPSRN